MSGALTLTARNLPMLAQITNADAMDPGPTVARSSPAGQLLPLRGVTLGALLFVRSLVGKPTVSACE